MAAGGGEWYEVTGRGYAPEGEVVLGSVRQDVAATPGLRTLPETGVLGGVTR